jgi:hypothetical protein
MGRKKADAPLPPKSEAEKVRPSEVTQLINEKQLLALLRADDGYKEEIDGVVGQLREKIAYAVDKQHLNKKAYAIVKSFNRMSAEKLADLWPVILVYMDMAGLMKRIEAVQRLDLGDEETDGGGKTKPTFGGRTAGEVAKLAETTGATPAS